MTPIKVIIIAIDDALYLPSVFSRLFQEPSIQVVACCLIPITQAVNMHPNGAVGWRSLLSRSKLYGLKAFAKFAFLALRIRFLAAANKRQTLSTVAAAHGISVINCNGSVNEPALVERLEKLNADVAIGVFSEKADGSLRRVSKRGLLLLHYSLLPKFAGREPTFWTMLEEPSGAGITFFEASDSFDGGAVVLQAGMSLKGVKSLQSAIMMLSELAGKHISEAVIKFVQGNFLSSAMAPLSQAKKMRGWPTPLDVRRFRARGLVFV